MLFPFPLKQNHQKQMRMFLRPTWGAGQPKLAPSDCRVHVVTPATVSRAQDSAALPPLNASLREMLNQPLGSQIKQQQKGLAVPAQTNLRTDSQGSQQLLGYALSCQGDPLTTTPYPATYGAPCPWFGQREKPSWPLAFLRRK